MHSAGGCGRYLWDTSGICGDPGSEPIGMEQICDQKERDKSEKTKSLETESEDCGAGSRKPAGAMCGCGNPGESGDKTCGSFGGDDVGKSHGF